MRNKHAYILLLVFTMICGTSMACDICGCGAGSYYVGILPEFSKKIIGVRYRYNTLRTHIGAGGVTTYLTTEEMYRTTELWGGWTIGKRFRLMGYVPAIFNEKLNQGITTKKNGLGDMGVQGFYKLFNSDKAMGAKRLVQSLWIGAGVKVPTGEYDATEKNGSQQTANIFQLGTGSVDLTFNAMYDIRLQDAGISLSGSYKLNTKNKESYRYGNKVSANAQVYYKIRIKQLVTLAPNAGIMYERAGVDKDHGYTVDVSGGNVLLGTAGIEAAYKRMAIGCNWQSPMSQNLAGGFVKASNRAMVHISFMF
jgi:hypothetical protein